MPYLSSASGRRSPQAFAAAILALSVLLLALAACGGKDDPVPEPAAPPADAEPVAPAPTPFVVMESPPVPVGTTVAEPARGALPALEITAAKPTAVPAPIAPQPVPPTAVVLEAVPSATPVVAVASTPTVIPLDVEEPAPVPTADPQEPAAAEEQGSIASVDGELTLERVLERNQEAMSKVTSFRFKIRVLTNGIYCEDSRYPGFLYVEGHYVAPHQLYARITERDNVVAEWEPGMDAVITPDAVFVRYYWRDRDGGLGGRAKYADWKKTALNPKNRRIGDQFTDPTLSLEDIFYSLPWSLPVVTVQT